MFERFTERARQVVVLAQEEARLNECRYIGAEHILIGVLREEEGLAARVLASLDVELEPVREIVKGLSEGAVPEDKEASLPFTPRAKKCLELALREALTLGHNYIGTEHILLGILREGDNKGLEILAKNFGLAAVDVRKEVVRMLSGPKAPILSKGTPDTPKVQVDQHPAELRPGRYVDDLDVIATAVTLGRQYPDRPATVIAKAALALLA